MLTLFLGSAFCVAVFLTLLVALGFFSMLRIGMVLFMFLAFSLKIFSLTCVFVFFGLLGLSFVDFAVSVLFSFLWLVVGSMVLWRLGVLF